MQKKSEIAATLLKLERECGFEEGFKLLYCPWERIGDARIAFISLNPGRAPNGSEMRTVDDPQGNTYYAERTSTKSPLTHQFLEMCRFIKSDPEEVLTGAFFPFRSNKWTDVSSSQIKEVLKFSRPFWKAATENCDTIIVVSNLVANNFIDLLECTLESTVSSNWGSTNLKRYTSSAGQKIIQLPHLSSYKIFSRADCQEPLHNIFDTANL